MTDEIVITGMGIVSPIGVGESAFWDSLTSGRSGAGPVHGFDTTDLSRTIACQVNEPIDVGRSMGRASSLAVAASRQAIASAGLTLQQLKKSRSAVVVGTTMGETQFIEDRLALEESQWLNESHVHAILGGLPGCIAGNVRADLGVEAPAYDLYGACAAGNMALADARRRLLSGDCDFVVAGGADGFSFLAFVGFMRLRVMAAEICRPFDSRRDGLLVGEGAGMFVLERASSAKARGATVRARLSGCGLACENYHPTRPHPDGDGLTRSTKAALLDSGLSPGEIEYVSAHGTGTPQNDAIEWQVMERCFPDGVRFSSIKALTGHTMGAASALAAAACVLCLEKQVLIPAWHLDEPSDSGTIAPVIRGLVSGPIRHVLNNSAGFGGYNASVVLSAA